MKSVRLTERQETRLKQAAQITGKPESEVIRTAIDEHCDRILGNSLEQQLADVIGSIAGDGSGYSERTGEAFKKLLRNRSSR